MTNEYTEQPAMKPLERDYLRLIRWIGLAVCVLISGVLTVVVGIAWSVSWYWCLLAWPFVLMTVFMPLNVYLKQWYQKYGYYLDDDKLAIRRGVFWRHHISVPISRVQHVDVNSGPLDRRYGLAKLVVNTAGTHYAQTSLPGLTREEAHAVRDQLLAAQEGDTV